MSEVPLSKPSKPGSQSLARFVTSPLGEFVLLLVLALATGVVGGLGAILFRMMINWAGVGISHLLALVPGMPLFGEPRQNLPILGPLVGLLAVSFISKYLAPEVKGHGIPQILEALALRGGRIRSRVASLGIVAPALTIGSGGSVGQEGPIALIGASFGSVMGQVLRLSDRYLSLLVASGAAAGIAATFNAPIAGAFFGMEVVLGSYAMGVIVPTMVAAVTGSITFNAIMGNHLVLPTTTFGMAHPGEFFVMLLLGAIAGLVGLAYTQGLHLSENLFGNWRVPFWVKPVTGGALVAALGLFVPRVLGVGYETMDLATTGGLTLGAFFVLLVSKYLATLITIGAGGSGGVFAPSLFLGTMLGGSFGAVAHGLFPNVVAVPQAYAVVGMGAVFAAAAQAPLTAIIIILEMTGDYAITVGVMAACAMSYFVYGSLARDSMYTVKLTKRGIVILRGTEVRPTERIPVSAAQQPFENGIPATTPLETVYRQYTGSAGHRQESLILVDEAGSLYGVVSPEEVWRAIGEEKGALPVGDVASRNVITVFPDQSVEEAMRLFALYDYRMLPVVSRTNPAEVVGVLGRSDALAAYSTHTMHSFETTRKVQLLRELAKDQGVFREMVLLGASPLAGRTLADTHLPPQCLLVTVTRNGDVLIPHGNTVLKPGDRVLFFCSPSHSAHQVEELVQGHGPHHRGHRPHHGELPGTPLPETKGS